MLDKAIDFHRINELMGSFELKMAFIGQMDISEHVGKIGIAFLPGTAQ
jgi:hypothetical protein